MSTRPTAAEFPTAVTREALRIARRRANAWAADLIGIIASLDPRAMPRATRLRDALSRSDVGKAALLEFDRALRRERSGRLRPGGAYLVAIDIIRRRILELADAAERKLPADLNILPADAEPLLSSIRDLLPELAPIDSAANRR
jgi:hypothetical protein